MLEYFKETLSNVVFPKDLLEWDSNYMTQLEINALNVSRIELETLCQIHSKDVSQTKFQVRTSKLNKIRNGVSNQVRKGESNQVTSSTDR